MLEQKAPLYQADRTIQTGKIFRTFRTLHASKKKGPRQIDAGL
ncbi:hypothetical protein [Janthinobacterium sp. HH01]|nr:hypothetical protein [Janthinobacterium sp. HH01]